MIIMVRSMVGDPKIILFDDANANFDIKNDKRLIDVMKIMQQKNKTIVIVSHRPSFLKLCHRQFQLQDGTLQPRQ
ncbi:hypothetical protein [methane-oxidizing endosymbiont of Gigantopelta aegis]|uniref:hypothetical protein n=1 Tax=methane-oxidizing endosymbiont of Gigantopelta aegis TaxID=2794938 RepID=UPI0018DCF0EA|nr:hypothetical protein [methane-oxidizing endosymbiont of Gigantopelta aegis]